MFATTNDNQQPRAEPNETTNVPVAIRGNRETYEVRETLKRVGLRWNPTAHSWAGSVPAQKVDELKGLGLPVVALVPDESPLATLTPDPVAPTLPSKSPSKKGCPTRRSRKPSLGGTFKDRAETFLGEHGWDLRDITANLSDDDRAEDERRVQRHLRDLRSRVKAARAAISADPEVARTLAINPEKAAAFYAIHGVTEAQVMHGVPDLDVQGLEWDDLADALRGHFAAELVGSDWMGEEAHREAAILPGSDEGVGA
jgi:hypothetical protein